MGSTDNGNNSGLGGDSETWINPLIRILGTSNARSAEESNETPDPTRAYEPSIALVDFLEGVKTTLGLTHIAIAAYQDRHSDFRIVCQAGSLTTKIRSAEAPQFLCSQLSRLAARCSHENSTVTDVLESSAGDNSHTMWMTPFEAALQCRGVVMLLRSTDLGRPDVARNEQVYQLIAQFVVSKLELHWERRVIGLFASIVSRISLLSEDLSRISSEIARTAVDIGNASGSTIYWSDVDNHQHIHLQAHAGMSRHYNEIKTGSKTTWITGQVAKKRRTRLIHNLLAEARAANQSIIEQEGHKTAILVPILSKYMDGAICVYYKSSTRVDRATQRALELLGMHVGITLDNRQTAVSHKALREHIAELSHSLKSPVNKIATNANNIDYCVANRKFDGVAGECAQMLEVVDLVTTRVDSLLYVMEGTAEVAGINRQLVDISALTARVIERLRPEADEHGVKVEVKGPVGSVMFPCDRAKIDLVMENLLQNAIKYSWSGESVTVTILLTPRTLSISISDNGLGIPTEHFESIFRPLFRSPIMDRERYIHGTGLGLSIARQLVRSHGGDIQVSSIPFLDDPERRAQFEGFTTAFTITIPKEQ